MSGKFLHNEGPGVRLHSEVLAARLMVCESRTRLHTKNEFGRSGGEFAAGLRPSASIKFEGN